MKVLEYELKKWEPEVGFYRQIVSFADVCQNGNPVANSIN